MSSGAGLAGRALRSTHRDVLLIAAVVACSLSTTTPARAGDVEVARKIFADGVKLYQQGDYEGARRLFVKADAEHHAPPIVYNLGLAEERLGNLQAAVEAYEAYVAEAGETGDFAPVAAIAIAQIKARSTRLRIVTKPSGARLFVGARALDERSPTTYLVPAGHHVIVAQGEGWRLEQDVEAKGAGDALEIVLERSESDPPSALAKRAAPSTDKDVASLPPAPTIGPDGLVWGAHFMAAPIILFGSKAVEKGNTDTVGQVVAGFSGELGHAVSDRFEFFGRVVAALGPDGKPSYAVMGGPGVSIRLAPWFWFGPTFVGGTLETKARGTRYGTGLVFGGILEASFAVLSTPSGQWMVGFNPTLLLTDAQDDNSIVLFSGTIGYRGY